MTIFLFLFFKSCMKASNNADAASIFSKRENFPASFFKNLSSVNKIMSQ